MKRTHAVQPDTKYPIVMYRKRTSEGPDSLLETPELVDTAAEEQAALRRGWRRESSYLDADQRERAETYLIARAAEEKANLKYVATLSNQEKWTVMRTHLPVRILALIPETYSEGAAPALAALKSESELLSEPRLSVEVTARETAERLVSKFETVPPEFHKLMVGYGSFHQEYGFDGSPAAIERFKVLSVDAARACGYQGQDPVKYWLDLLREKAPSKRVAGLTHGTIIVFGEYDSEHTEMWDVFTESATLLMKLAQTPHNPTGPTRAQWLTERLKERSWNKHDLKREDGPDHKTVQKILNGEDVREDILGKLASALSKKFHSVSAVDIPAI